MFIRNNSEILNWVTSPANVYDVIMDTLNKTTRI